MAVGCIIYRVGSAHIKSVEGLMSSMPWTASAFIIAGLSLIGVPLTAGFISKWYLISAAIDSGWWLIAVMMLFSSLMAVIYIGKVIEAMCFPSLRKKPENDDIVETNVTATKEAPLALLMPLWLLVGLSVYMGIDSHHVIDVAHNAAAQLLGTVVGTNVGGTL